MTCTPDLLPPRWRDKTLVCHSYPDEWDKLEVDTHRFDECPCVPRMTQELGHGRGYYWIVQHRRLAG